MYNIELHFGNGKYDCTTHIYTFQVMTRLEVVNVTFAIPYQKINYGIEEKLIRQLMKKYNTFYVKQIASAIYIV